MRHLHRFAWLPLLGLVSTASAQMGTETIADQDLGRPPRPPFITFETLVNPEKMATEPTLAPRGAVAEVLYEELRAQTTQGGPAGEVIDSIRTRYDGSGRVIEEAHKGNQDGVTVSRYEGTRLVSQETTTGKSPQKAWSDWKYDASGKLVEYRKGNGDQLQNHDTNFKRDAQGRLVTFEYRQGPKDELFRRTQYRYSPDGKTIDMDDLDASGNTLNSLAITLDDRGRVIQAVIREPDPKTKQMKAPYKIAFKYDEKGRLVEQNTDPRPVEQSDEQALPPGKISITYDDAKNTKTNLYTTDEGTVSMTATRDANGATVAFAITSGPVSAGAKLNCAFDSHGNWTSCEQIATASGVTRRNGMWRRKITYRP